MSDYIIYHNPRCSKSRQTLELIEQQDIKPTIRLYIKDPLAVAELKDLLKLLDMTPRQLLRTKEAAYKDMGLDNAELSDDDIILAITKEPKLMERPIVTSGSRAIIGRPPENVLEIL